MAEVLLLNPLSLKAVVGWEVGEGEGEWNIVMMEGLGLGFVCPV
jgi:hypothetical protein